ncbi:MAG: hypothetical protein ACKVQS_05860 [Fimbriimonadaceae bacterium]
MIDRLKLTAQLPKADRIRVNGFEYRLGRIKILQNSEFPTWITIDTNLPKCVTGTNLHFLSLQVTTEVIVDIVQRVSEFLILPELQDMDRWLFKYLEIGENRIEDDPVDFARRISQHYLDSGGANISCGKQSHTVRIGPKQRNTRIYPKGPEFRKKEKNSSEDLKRSVDKLLRHEIAFNDAGILAAFGTKSLGPVLEFMNSDFPIRMLEKSWDRHVGSVDQTIEMPWEEIVLRHFPGRHGRELITFRHMRDKFGELIAKKMLALSPSAVFKFQSELRTLEESNLFRR